MYILESCLRLCHEYLLLLLLFEREYRLFLIEVGMYLFLFTYGGWKPKFVTVDVNALFFIWWLRNLCHIHY